MANDNVKKNQKIKKDNQLCGGHNERLEKTDSTNSEGTAAWQNIGKQQDRTKVTIPSDYSVQKAKNWVDNGSQT